MTISEATSSLRRDERGAVLVLGVFMGACLVGMLWYLAGIGDAILQRQRLQEAADAAAFSSAVLHARGMNLLVLMNLIMACVLGVRVTLKAVEVALGIAAIFCGIVPGLQPFVAVCTQGIVAVQNAINATRAPINQTLGALSKGQKAFATIVPAAAVAGAAQVGSRYRPVVTSAIASSPIGLKGLPVEEESIDRLCSEAGQSVVGLLSLALPSGLRTGPARLALEKIEDVVGQVVATGGAFFCELGGGSAAAPDLSAHTLDLAKDACARESTRRRQEGRGGRFDLEQCQRDEQEKMQRKVQPGAAGVSSGVGMTPKKLISSWQNGTDAAQLNAIAFGSGLALNAGAQGVRAGAWEQAPVSRGSAPGEQGFAQAELFFDCTGRWSSAACNGPGGSELGLWNFRWRARLRRCNPGLSRLAQVEGGASLIRSLLSSSPADAEPRLVGELQRAARQGVIH